MEVAIYTLPVSHLVAVSQHAKTGGGQLNRAKTTK